MASPTSDRQQILPTLPQCGDVSISCPGPCSWPSLSQTSVVLTCVAAGPSYPSTCPFSPAPHCPQRECGAHPAVYVHICQGMPFEYHRLGDPNDTDIFFPTSSNRKPETTVPASSKGLLSVSSQGGSNQGGEVGLYLLYNECTLLIRTFLPW